ncbi:MAG: sialidase family protein, partial [Limnochordia bacterium]
MPRLVKEEEISIYRNDSSYVVPTGSLTRLGTNELLLTFREAPRRGSLSHVDPESTAVLLRSADGGRTWGSKTLIYADPDPHCGVQDPSLAVLADGTLIASFFKWRTGAETDLPPDPPPGRYVRKGPLGLPLAWVDGVYVLRSWDGGRTWEHTPIPVITPLGRAATTSDPVLELPDNDLLLPGHGIRPDGSDVAFVIRSSDGGESWGSYVEVATEANGVIFMEPSIVSLPSGRLLAMFRTRGSQGGGHLFQAESDDGGLTWRPPWKTPLWGCPPQLLMLDSGNLLCVYGYRRKPFGVRTCLSTDEGRTWDPANETILFDEGGSEDLGYPACVQLADGEVLVA